ncbi:MAG: hypothetical protein IKU82_06065 [Clostridia bacterium]|nr:hypothetical protein [Clostridia bacterium]
MDNKTLFAVLCILFNSIGVPCFMQGNTKTGILRIVLGIVTCSVLFAVNAIMGIILGIKVLKMTDEEFEASKATLSSGIPK